MIILLIGAFLLLGAAEANATVTLSIHNAGCQDMKVYKKSWGYETYKATISAGGNWSCYTSYNQEYVFRKTNGSYLSNYFCTNSNTQNHNCDSGGCSGGGGNCGDQLAHWNLNACSAGSSYNEFTAATNTPTGFASVSASIFSNLGDHSCNYGQSGEGMCHAIKDGCSWSNNDNNSYKFSVTIKPTTGNSATLSKLTFYESAPSSYTWVGGGSGDNDPPSKYGVRVTKNGTEIFKQVDIATTSAWSLETLDFSADPDFTVTSQTTFNVEILGYCRQGTSGYAVWDVDEIKVYGCSTNVCASQGGDTDGDGVCNNNDCAPTNAALPATPGTACNDGNANTTNDIIQADGCTCAGTPSCNLTATFSVPSGCLTNSYLIFADANDPYFPPNNPNYTYSYDIQPANTVAGLASVDPRSVTASFNAPGVKTVTATITNPAVPNCQIVKQTSFTVTDCSPCANQGGDTDGDGVCNNNDCQPNNPAFPATPGSPCNDGNANTTNDVIQADGCSCAGTPVPVCDNVTSGGTIGFGTACASSTSVACNTAAPSITDCVTPSGGSGVLESIWLKSTTSCSYPTTSAAQVMAGLDPHWSIIPGQTGLTLSPGVVSANTCYLRCTRRVGCGTFLESNIISLTTDCGGGPDCVNGISITADNGTITISGLDGAPISSVNIFNAGWGQAYACFANCGATQTVNVAAGTYYVFAKYYTASYSLICEKQLTVTVTGGSPCANLGGDTDGDGVCNNNDCQPNNPAFPATPGSPATMATPTPTTMW
ncbi:MAG: hypothetical protein IPM82_27400 [Saprospiraceae bacterium]|nr:hypothetical protein [Saprospiraceae bacterium]